MYECAYNIEAEAQYVATHESLLNTDQRHCVQYIVHAIQENRRTAQFFLQGAGGTGKTYLYQYLSSYYRSQQKIVLCVASLGVAALLLPGGRTAHSVFKIPLQVHEHSTCIVDHSSYTASLLRCTDLIIWDEVPMLHRYCIEAVHRTMVDIRGDSNLFGGVPVMLGGDFAQILPVIPHANRAVIVAASLRQSFIWGQLKILKLTQNMRLFNDSENQEYARWIQKLPYDPNLRGLIDLPSSLRSFTDLQSFCDIIFPVSLLYAALHDPDLFLTRAILV